MPELLVGGAWHPARMDEQSQQASPYDPPECQVCGKPVTVVKVERRRTSGSYEELERRCLNPECRLNGRGRRMSDAP